MAPYKWYFAIVLILLPVMTGLSLAQPWLLQVAIDDFLLPQEVSGLWLLLGGYALTVVGHALLTYLQEYLMLLAGQNALRDIRQELFEHVQGLSSSFFKKNPVGRLMSRLTTDVESLQEALTSGIVTMIGDIITLTAIVVILLVMNWKL